MRPPQKSDVQAELAPHSARRAISAPEGHRRMVALGVRRFEYTDINRDGTMTEPNFEAVTEAVNYVSVPIIAAGGIANVRHLERLAELGVEGAIVGKALYTGAVILPEVLEKLSSQL